jgi:hypothetical protein
VLRQYRAWARLAAGTVALLLLSGCGQSAPAWGPDTPRNGAGQPVHPIYGTPLPGSTMGSDIAM